MSCSTHLWKEDENQYNMILTSTLFSVQKNFNALEVSEMKTHLPNVLLDNVMIKWFNSEKLMAETSMVFFVMKRKN